MSAKANERLVQMWVDRIWNKQQWAALADFHPASFQNEGQATTLADVQAWHERTRSTFPDLHYTIDDLVVVATHATLRWTAKGTHEGALWGFIQPTGKAIQWNGIHMLTIADGKIIEIWAVANTLAQLQQMGVQLQPPAAA